MARNRWFTYEKWWFSMAMLHNQLVIVNVDPLVNVGWLRLYISLTIVIPPLNPGIFGGGRTRNFSEIFHLTTWNIPPPTCFLGFSKSGGVLRIPHFSPEMVWHTLSLSTYVHTYIHTCMHSTRPWRDHYKPDFFSWNISRCGGGDTPPFWNI